MQAAVQSAVAKSGKGAVEGAVESVVAKFGKGAAQSVVPNAVAKQGASSVMMCRVLPRARWQSLARVLWCGKGAVQGAVHSSVAKFGKVAVQDVVHVHGAVAQGAVRAAAPRQACQEWHPEVGYDPTYRGDNDVYLCPRLGVASRPPAVVSCCFSSDICYALHRNLPVVGQGGRRARALVWTRRWLDHVVLVDMDLLHTLCHRRLTEEEHEGDDAESVLISADALVERAPNATKG